MVEPTETIADPRERLQALCNHFLSYLGRRVFPGGCFFASAGAEFDTHPGPVKDKIAAIQEGFTEGHERLIREAQAAGSLAASEDPAQLAFELHAYLLMGNTVFVLTNNDASLEQARAAITSRLARAA